MDTSRDILREAATEEPFAYLRKFGYLRNVILVFHCGLVHVVYPVSTIKVYAFEDNDSQSYIHRRSPLLDGSGICGLPAFQYRINATCHLPLAADCWRHLFTHRAADHPGRAERNIYQPGRIRPSPTAKVVRCNDLTPVNRYHHRLGYESRVDTPAGPRLRTGAAGHRATGE